MAANATGSDLESTTSASNVRVVDLPDMHGVKLDAKIGNIIQGISSEALAGLTESVKMGYGCREPVLAYRDQGDGTLYLVDGFTRIDICIEHNLPLPRGLLINDLHDRGAALQWRIDQHINRRNMCPRWISYLWGAKYNSEKRAPHRPSDTTELHQTEGETAQHIAEQAGVSRATIERNARLAQSIDQLKRDLGDEFGNRILNREFKNLTLVDINNLAGKSVDDKKALADILMDNPELSLADAETRITPPEPDSSNGASNNTPTPSPGNAPRNNAGNANNRKITLSQFKKRQETSREMVYGIVEVDDPAIIPNMIKTEVAIIKKLRDLLKASSGEV